jgi:diphthamide biosynthesis methyltransferase
MVVFTEVTMETNPEFLLRRAKEESVKALEAEDPAAASVHEQLAIRYSAKAALLLAGEDVGGLPSDRTSEGLTPG